MPSFLTAIPRLVNGLGIENTTETTPVSSFIPEGVDPKLWEANPYANIDYRHTWWQQFLEVLGFRTNYDVFRESMAVNAKEYERDVLEKAHNEEYDSPINQNARLRQAGINPDLAGETSSGDSSPMQPDPNGPISPEATDFSKISGFFNGVMGALSTAIGFAKDFMSISQIQNAIDAGKIDNAKSLFDFGYNTAVNFIPEQYPEGDPDWLNRSASLAYDMTAPLLPKKMQKQYRQQLNAFYASAPKQAKDWEAWLANVTGKKGWFMDTSSEFWKDGSDEVLRDISNSFVKVLDKYKWQIANTNYAQAKYGETAANKDSQYLQSLDPSLSAEVENMTNRRNLASGNIDRILNEAMNEIVVDLKDRSESNKKGHALASTALIFLSFLRMTNFHPSFSSHTSTGSTPWGPTSSSSRSFGF